jgi:hypothetical protein
VAAITAKMGGTPAARWRIGLTHTAAERKQYWADTQSTVHSSQWIANSLAHAQAIETLFLNHGVHGETGGGDLSVRRIVYVYIF